MSEGVCGCIAGGFEGAREWTAGGSEAMQGLRIGGSVEVSG